MIRFSLFLFCLVLNFYSPAFGTAQSNVFTVDIAKLLRHTNIGKKIILENKSSRKSLQKENDKLEAELLFEEKNLSELRNKISTDEFRAKAIEFDEKVTTIRSEQAKKEEILNDKIRKEEAAFYKIIYPLLYEILSDRGGTILLDQRNVVLWDSSVDITSDAIISINNYLEDGIQLID